MTSAKRTRQPSPIVPLLLIGAGLLVLAVNAGWLDWHDLASVAQLWPLLLLAAGVDILLNGRYRLVVMLATVLAAAAFYALGFGILPATDVTTRPIDHALTDVARADIHLQTGISELHLRTDPDTASLIEGNVVAGPEERIVETYREQDGVALFTLRTEQRGIALPGPLVGRRVWDLAMSRAIPTNLRIDTGVGRAELELADALLSNLHIGTGVGSVSVTLPRTGTYRGSVETGVGATTIRIPSGVAARIHSSRGLGAVTIRGDLEQSGDVYTSSGFASAEHRVDLAVTTGVGTVTIIVER